MTPWEREDWLRLGAVFALGLVLVGCTALLKQQPGYMDADYHFAIAGQINAGRGLSEPFVWNYLSGYPPIPHPSNTYWSPLPALLSAAALRLLGTTHLAVQFPFVVMAALLCPLTYWLARMLGARSIQALTAGALVPVAGFYAAYWSSPDSFAPFALFGALCLAMIALGAEGRPGLLLGAGVFAGLGHLARPDGILLPVIGIVCIGASAGRRWHARDRGRELRRAALGTAALLGGYLVIMGPWMARTFSVTGTLFGTQGLTTALLTDYDQLYAARNLPSLAPFLSQGLGPVLSSRAKALLDNLATLTGALFMLLAPFSAIGLWRARSNRLVLPPALFGVGLYLSMSLVFALPGIRGSFFHSAGALLPFLLAAALPGLEAAVAWAAARRRGWNAPRATRAFTAGAVVLSVAVGTLLFVRAVLVGGAAGPAWNERDSAYKEVAAWLSVRDSALSPVLVVNPPAYYNRSGQPCVAIPSDGYDALVEVAVRYGAKWLLLEGNHPAYLNAFWEEGGGPEWLFLETEISVLGSRVKVYGIR